MRPRLAAANCTTVTFSTLRPKRDVQHGVLQNKHTVKELLIGDFQLYGNPEGALYVRIREELSSSIA